MSMNPEVVATLVKHQREFLAFLTPRVGSVEVAREVLQAAFVKGLEKGDSLHDEESAVAWFYRLLRNALVDAWRRQQREAHALEKETAQAPLSTEDVEKLEATVCGCVKDLASTLKPEYAAAVQRVDLEGTPVSAFAQEVGISSGNAAVRLHRARQALGRRLLELCGTCCALGCVDCTCAPQSAPPS
jgi:RNA polymerase sigma-70 factor (ECF subfamily)